MSLWSSAADYLRRKRDAALTGDNALSRAVEKSGAWIESNKKPTIKDINYKGNSVAGKVGAFAYNTFAKPVAQTVADIPMAVVDAGRLASRGVEGISGRDITPIRPDQYKNGLISMGQGITDLIGRGTHTANSGASVGEDLRGVGRGVSDLVNVWTPTNVLGAAKNGSLKMVMKEGAKAGFKGGLVGGAATGIQEGNTVNDQLKNAAISGAVGGTLGAGVGAVAPVIPHAASRIVKGANKVLPVVGKAADSVGEFAGLSPKARGNFKNVVGKNSKAAYGGLGGFETYEDEDGKTKVRFNPEKAAMGMAVMGGVERVGSVKAAKAAQKAAGEVIQQARVSLSGKGQKQVAMAVEAKTKIAPKKQLEAGNTQRGFVTSVKNSDLAGEIRSATIGRYDKRNTKALADRSMERVGSEDVLTTYNRLMNKKEGTFSDEDVADAIVYAKKVTQSGTPAEQELASDLLTRTAEHLTKAGQTAQAASLLQKMTPEGVMYQLSKMTDKKGNKISADVITKLVERTKAMQDLPEGRERNLAFQKIQEEIRDLFPSSAANQLVSFWKAGLLTGLKTTGLNVAANTANATARTVSSVPAAMADSVMGLFTGLRTKTTTTAGLGKGAMRGIAEGWDYLIHGYDPNKIPGKDEAQGIAFSKNILGKMGKAYTESIFRFIGAQDRPFYFAAMQNSLEDQARAAAKTQRLKGDAFTSFVKNFVDNPPEEAVLRSTADAERAVFQNDTLLNRAAQGMKKPLGAAGEALIPFAKTPSSVVTEIFNYQPTAPLIEAVSQIKAGKFDQRAMAEVLGKATTGTSVLWLGYELGKAGLINGSYPTDERERTRAEAENRKSNSLILGDQQIDLQSLGPLGAVLGMGAAASKEEGMWNMGAAGLTQGAKQVVESPWMQGMTNVQDIVSPPAGSTVADRAGKYVATQAGSVVPTFASDVAQWMDKAPNGQSNVRTVAGMDEGLLKPIKEGIMNRTPGLRDNLPQSFDVYGNPRTTGKNTFQTMLDPTRSQKLNRNAILEEVGRLQDLGEKASPTKTEKTQKAFGQSISLTKSEIEQLEQKTGGQITKRFESVMNNPSYQNLSDPEKAEILRGIVSDVRQNASKSMVVNGKETTLSQEVTPTSAPKSSSKAKPTKDEIDMAKYEVESGATSRKLMGDGETVVYKDPETGVAKVTKLSDIKEKATEKSRKNDIEQAKRDENYTKWFDLQDKQFQYLQEKIAKADPELDAVDILAWENEMADIVYNASKYKSYGGSFTKPKKPKAPKIIGGASRTSASKIKVTASPRLKVATPTIKLKTVPNGKLSPRGSITRP